MSATSVLVTRPRDHAPSGGGTARHWPGSAQGRMTPLGVMVLENHEVGQVAHCGQADRYGSVTQTIAILCRPLIRTTCFPPCTYATIWPYSDLHTHPPRPSPARRPRTRFPPAISRTAFLRSQHR